MATQPGSSVESGTGIRVSVIMVFLNAGRYIADAIDSVIGQTIPDWELVLVDDGSTDDSRAIAESHASRDPARIRIYSHPGGVNLGIASSRNLGFRQARGKYIAFLDADDLYYPERLERCVRLLDEQPGLGVVINRELYWRRWGEQRDRRLLPDEVVGPSAEYGRLIPPPRLIASTLATPGASMPAVCSLTFRRDTIRELGGIPEQFNGLYEDQVLIAKLLLACSAIVIPDCLAIYRQHPESLTHLARREGTYRPGLQCDARQSYITWLAQYLRSQGINEPHLESVIEAEQAPLPGGALAYRVRLARKWLVQLALRTVGIVLPRSVADWLITTYWAKKRARVAQRATLTAREVETRDQGQ